jgi:hypothetical protein
LYLVGDKPVPVSGLAALGAAAGATALGAAVAFGAAVVLLAALKDTLDVDAAEFEVPFA